MNKTTPLSLSSTSCFNVVFSPSLVSIVPPNPSRSIASPTATFLSAAGAAGAFFFGAGSSSFLAAGSALAAGLLALEAFLGAGAGAGGWGALRLRNSTGIFVLSYLCQGSRFREPERGIRAAALTGDGDEETEKKQVMNSSAWPARGWEEGEV